VGAVTVAIVVAKTDVGVTALNVNKGADGVARLFARLVIELMFMPDIVLATASV